MIISKTSVCPSHPFIYIYISKHHFDVIIVLVTFIVLTTKDSTRSHLEDGGLVLTDGLVRLSQLWWGRCASGSLIISPPTGDQEIKAVHAGPSYESQGPSSSGGLASARYHIPQGRHPQQSATSCMQPKFSDRCMPGGFHIHTSLSSFLNYGHLM